MDEMLAQSQLLTTPWSVTSVAGAFWVHGSSINRVRIDEMIIGDESFLISDDWNR